MHNDIAEIYYQFIGDAFRDKIEYLEIRLHLPEEDDDLRVWAHGSLNGEIYKNDDNDGVIATIKNLKKGNPVDIRMTFDKSMISLLADVEVLAASKEYVLISSKNDATNSLINDSIFKLE